MKMLNFNQINRFSNLPVKENFDKIILCDHAEITSSYKVPQYMLNIS